VHQQAPNCLRAQCSPVPFLSATFNTFLHVYIANVTLRRHPLTSPPSVHHLNTSSVVKEVVKEEVVKEEVVSVHFGDFFFFPPF
jgi:hypothetical protein